MSPVPTAASHGQRDGEHEKDTVVSHAGTSVEPNHVCGKESGIGAFLHQSARCCVGEGNC